MLQDFRYALRLLRRSPAFTITATLTMAIAIGANTAMFSIVKSTLLAPLPFADAKRVMAVWHAYPPAQARAAVSAPGFYDLQSARHPFDEVAAWTAVNANLTGAGDPERIVVARVTHSFQPVLGLHLAAGRWFSPDEDVPNQNDAIVVSDGLWRRLGADPSLVGRTLSINDRSHRVVGVMAAGALPKNADAWVPIAFTAEQRGPNGRGSEYLDAIGRLRSGLTVDAARAELKSLADTLRATYYADTPRWTLDMRPFADELVGEARPVLLAAFGAVGFVLLIACANVANLLLARAGGRRRELAVRAAVGAAPSRLRRQLLVETAVLGAAGAACGLAFAVVALPVFARAVARSLPQVSEPRIDAGVFVFVLLVSVVSALAFGLVPAWQLSRADLRASLVDAQRGASGRRAGRAFVVAEVAMAFALIVGAGLLVRSFARLIAIDPGFAVDRRLTLRVTLPAARYAGPPQRARFWSDAIGRLAGMPGVRAAAAVSELPLSDMRNMGTFDIEGRPVPRGAEFPHANWRSVSPQYFAAMGIQMMGGRPFADRDALGAPGVAVIDEVAATRYWPGADPIGRRVSLGTEGTGRAVWREIVGVVRSVRHDSLEDTPRATLYVPLAQRPTVSAFAVIETDRDALAQIASARAAIHAVDPQLPVYDARSLDSRLADSVGKRRIATWLIGMFGLFAVALAAIGVYGIVAYDVSERSAEIAVRVALGADQRSIVALVLGGGMRLAALGVASGALLALPLGRAAGALLFGISPYDVTTYITLAAALLGLTALATYLPARRAASVDPLATLRST